MKDIKNLTATIQKDLFSFLANLLTTTEKLLKNMYYSTPPIGTLKKSSSTGLRTLTYLQVPLLIESLLVILALTPRISVKNLAIKIILSIQVKFSTFGLSRDQRSWLKNFLLTKSA